MENEHGWTSEAYQATIDELERLGFYCSHPGVMTKAAGPVPLVIDLLPTDDTRPGWVRMSVPNGALVNLVKAPQRAEAAEASSALLRQALQFYADHTNWASYDGVDLAPFDRWTDSGMNGYDTAEEALKATNAGQFLLDHIKSLEEQVQQLTIEHGAMKRRIIGRPDWRCMKCGHYASGSGQWACSSCGEWHTWESVGNHNWHPDSPQGRAWLEPVTARFEAWLQKEAALDKLKEVSTNE